MGPGGSRGLQILRLGATSVRGGFDSHAFPPILLIAALLLIVAAGTAGAQGASRSSAVRDSVRRAAAQARVDSLRRAAAPRVPRPAAVDSVRRVLSADSLRRIAAADSLRPAASADSLARAAADSTRRAAADSLAPEARNAADLRRNRPVKRPFDEPRWVMLRSLVVPGWGQLYNRSWIKALLVAGVEVHMTRLVVDDLRALDRIQEQVDEARRVGDPAAEAARVNDYNLRLDQLTRREWWLGATVAYALLDAYIDAHFRNFDAEFEYDPALPGGQPSARVRLSYRWSF